MRETVSGGPNALGGRRLGFKGITLVVAVLLLVLLGYVYLHHRNYQSKTAFAGNDLTSSQLEKIKTNSAQSAVSSADYKTAVAEYESAATNAYVAKNYQQAKEIIKECIKKVPDASVPWTTYYSLAETAHALKDTTLEKSSLQTAISKSGQPGSTVDPSTIKLIQAQLDGLK